MDLENLKALHSQLKEREEAEKDDVLDSFGGENEELSEHEQETLAALEEHEHERQIVVSQSNSAGAKVDTSLVDYAKTLDDRIATIKSADGLESTVKMINSGEIAASADSIKEATRTQAIKAFKTLAVVDNGISDDDYITINNNAIKVLQDYLHMDRIDADVMIKKLSKLSLREIYNILPVDFARLYVTDAELTANNIKAKDRLLASLSYLAVTGPELDYLNEYIEGENRLAIVSQRLLQCQMDFSEMLKDERVISEIIKDTTNLCPVDDSFWAAHIKMPNRVHNEFAQRVVIQERYKEAYQKLLEDYPVISLAEYADDPAKLAEMAKGAALNEKARALIQTEIAEAENKIEIYTDVTEMTLLKTCWENVMETYGPNRKGKKITMDYLLKEAMRAIDRVRRCKQDLPFPGYDGSNRPQALFNSFVTDYSHMILNYNDTATTIAEKEPNKDISDFIIRVKGVPDEHTALCFSIAIALLMGRVVKRLSKNTATKYDAIQLDAYFQLFCRMGLDVYIMHDVWGLIKDFVIYVITEFYRPAYNKELKEIAKKRSHRQAPKTIPKAILQGNGHA